MAIRTAKAAWNGSLKEGNGTMALGSGAFEGPYSFSSRFEDGSGSRRTASMTRSAKSAGGSTLARSIHRS